MGNNDAAKIRWFDEQDRSRAAAQFLESLASRAFIEAMYEICDCMSEWPDFLVGQWRYSGPYRFPQA